MSKRFFIIIFIFLPALAFSQQQKGKVDDGDFDYYIAARNALRAGNVQASINYCEDGLKKEPANMDLHALLGKAYLQKGDLDRARTKLLFVLKVQPRNWDSKRNIISVEYQAKHYSAALSHINEFLEKHAPYDNEMWVKKISIYEIMGHRHEAERLADRLYVIFPQDSAAQRLHTYYTVLKAGESVKTGNLFKAKDDLLKVLADDPNNLEAHIQLINTNIKAGNKEEAIAAIEGAQLRFPGNSYFILKKLGLLEELKRYPEAIAYAELMQKTYPSGSYKTIITNLKFEAARNAKLSDPYYLYQDLLQTNPGNEEAQSYVINTAISRGLYEDADVYLNKALKSRPNSNDLLQKKYTVAKALGNTGQAYGIAEKLFLNNPGSSDYQEQYLNLALADAKGLIGDEKWAKAEVLLKKISRYPYVQPAVNEYLFSIYSRQKDYPNALAVIDDLIRKYPREDSYKLNKVGLLDTKGDYAAAIDATDGLTGSKRFKETYTTISLSLAKQYIDAEKYDSALIIVDRILGTDPENLQAYNYGINVSDAKKDYQSGIDYINSALIYFPEDKDLLLKQSGFLQALKESSAAVVILDILQKKYPYNDKIKASLIEARNSAANKYLVLNKRDSALELYKQNYAFVPPDTVAAFRIINIYLDDKNTDSALSYINGALSFYPDNATLLYKKAVTFELRKDFDSAYVYMAKIIPADRAANYQEYANYLQAKALKHQAGFLYLRTSYDSIQSKSSIASFQFTRFFKKNTYTYRLNYAARSIGTALQHEVDWTHIISKKMYSEANLGFSQNIIFPSYKISGSLFRTMKKGFEPEIGLKYVKFKNYATYSLIAGLSKIYREDIYLNFRGYVLRDTASLYYGARLLGRLYLNNHKEYITGFGGMGTAPDDLSLVFIPNKTLGISTTFVGAGYQKEIRYRTTLGLTGTWTNIPVSKKGFINQYNLFFTVLHKF